MSENEHDFEQAWADVRDYLARQFNDWLNAQTGRPLTSQTATKAMARLLTLASPLVEQDFGRAMGQALIAQLGDFEIDVETDAVGLRTVRVSFANPPSMADARMA